MMPPAIFTGDMAGLISNGPPWHSQPQASAEIARQAIVDIGSRDGSVTCCNRDLVKV
jgi:hypothetical protein